MTLLAMLRKTFLHTNVSKTDKSWEKIPEVLSYLRRTLVCPNLLVLGKPVSLEK